MTKVCDHCKGKKQLSGIHGYAWMLPCHKCKGAGVIEDED